MAFNDESHLIHGSIKRLKAMHRSMQLLATIDDSAV